ncbi:RhoGAP domain containing protein [Acanthamoeba castellanii str. Neff]|uniref:RhoGAP domain containing protein n=1 Tax=Acanthamoeba castellanii (strain ATCC 30010 / Neff) TaxID=1257118 RepID=L8GGS6_ACACF|nr:RhoGAP domain containing protein [Acanthamoeba castellanii str. Neff]ELR12039.1 RhoGAP domain containing protein [Acanthamoeba castellanii str. Neff]
MSSPTSRGAGWQELKDEASGQAYYYNSHTGETTWTTPPELQQQATPKNEWWELFDASRGRPYFYNPSTKQTVWEAPPGVTPLVIVPESGGGAAANGGQWNEVVDLKSGLTYYVNSATGQSSWVKPGSGSQQVTITVDEPASPVSVPPRPKSVMVRNGAPSSGNRHTVALGKGGGFAQSNNIPPPLPVLHTQDDINTSPPHVPAVAGLLRRQRWLAAAWRIGHHHAHRARGLHPRPRSSSFILPQQALAFSPHHHHHPPAGSLATIVSPRGLPSSSPGGGGSAAEAAAAATGLASGGSGGKEEKEGKKKGGSERKKKLAFRKTAIFGKEGKEGSKHKKTHSIGGGGRSASMSERDIAQGVLSNSGSHIISRADDLESDGSDIMPTMPKSIIVDINKFQLEGYARKFFNAQKKKGVFTRKKTPVKEMLMFQKQPLEVSLLNFHKPELQKKALDLFKLILAYQGVIKRETNESPLAIARQIAADGITEGQIRDELFCQLCKQTCYTPNEGWELMVVSCLTFPPTQDLEAWFRKYLEEHVRKGSDAGKEAIYARFCLKKLNLMCQKQGPSRGRVPSLREIEKIIAAPFHFSPFGADLEEIMTHERSLNPSAQVPRIVEFLCDSVMRLNGCNIEGLFRIPGDSEGIYTSKADIECGNFDISNFRDANVPAALLKLWMRELAHPLIPDALYDKALKSGHDPKRVKEVVDKCPKNNQSVIRYVIRFIQVLAQPENQARTKMNVNNLAMIFAPTFLRCPSDNPQDLMENTRYEQDFVHDLIVNLS